MNNKNQFLKDIENFATLLCNLVQTLETEKEPHYQSTIQHDIFSEISHAYNFNNISAGKNISDPASSINTEKARNLVREIEDWLDTDKNAEDLKAATHAFASYIDNNAQSTFKGGFKIPPPQYENATNHYEFAYNIAHDTTTLVEILNRWDKENPNGLNSAALRDVLTEQVAHAYINQINNDTQTEPSNS